MKTDAKTTMILLDKDTEVPQLREELLKLVTRAALATRTLVFVKEFPLTNELLSALAEEIEQ